jgi:tellurite methyltransferase
MRRLSFRQRRTNKWEHYYGETDGRCARALLVHTLARFDGVVGRAIDLGCGAGPETIELLRRGWCVVAIDSQRDALAWVRAQIRGADKAKVQTVRAAFGNVNLPSADLVWAGLSLPFCAPQHFPRLWNAITASLQPKGRFAGEFFGTRHAWVGNHDMIFHSLQQVRALFRSWEIEFLRENEGMRQTVLQGCQYFHTIEVIARKV